MAAQEETRAGAGQQVAQAAPDFDPALHISPFALFRRLREGDPPLLVDLRPRRQGRGEALSFAGAVPAAVDWTPPPAGDVVLFDDDGTAALERAQRLHAAGWTRVRALYGGLALYDFALDPEVVGEERFLVRAGRN
jgi:hypothetical protein